MQWKQKVDVVAENVVVTKAVQRAAGALGLNQREHAHARARCRPRASTASRGPTPPGASPMGPPDAAEPRCLCPAPFRSPPLRYGSRFGTVSQRSIWYGGEELETALGETAFYRFW